MPMEKILLFLVLMISTAHAAANMAVTSFSCNPSEVVASNQFSCTATIQNNGDATGTLNTATLYADGNNWMENSNYAETVNTNINSGASTQVTFDGMKGKKSGNNGFSKIMMDDVTDTYPADNGVKVNVIDVLGTVTASASSAASGATLTVTGQATAGGNVDVTLTFSVDSGSCSIGSQQSSATASGMTNGQTTSHTWTVTQGGNTCSYSIQAKATSKPSGTATKTDTTSGSITCSSGCTAASTSDTTSSTSSSTGGGGGSGSNATANATANKTATPQPVAAACRQSWDCSPWSDCADKKRTRICVDSNGCLNKKAGGLVAAVDEVQKPEELLECSLPVPYEVEKIIRDYGIWILGFSVIAVILGYLYYHGHHHVRKAARLVYNFRK